jgi:hypothetical protein
MQAPARPTTTAKTISKKSSCGAFMASPRYECE